VYVCGVKLGKKCVWGGKNRAKNDDGEKLDEKRCGKIGQNLCGCKN